MSTDHEIKMWTPNTMVLLLLILVGFGAVIYRMQYGLGAATNLNNDYPWGFWLGFDVLGGIAMAGGGFTTPVYAASWPTGEFGGMGLEGAVRLGFKKELDAVKDEAEREQLFETLVAKMYEIGKATEAAAHLEIDAVIDPADTRKAILRALTAAPKQRPLHGKTRPFVDPW